VHRLPCLKKAAGPGGRDEYLEGEVGMNAKGTLALSILSLATFVYGRLERETRKKVTRTFSYS
jgi:hypothetical protein